MHEELYEQRYETYTASIDNVRAYAGDDINDADVESALSELTERQGERTVDLNISDKDHINPSPSLNWVIENIQTVDHFETLAKEQIDDLEEDDDDGKIHEKVDTSAIFGNTVVTEPDDVDEPIADLQDKIETLLDQDGDVEIRFR